MPIIRVEMFKGRSVEQKRQLASELTTGFIRACGGTAETVQVVIAEVEKEDWARGGELAADRKPGG